jgi:transketolase
MLENKLYFVPLSELQRLRKAAETMGLQACRLLSNALRINTLYMIKNAGSGHIGTSFSSLDIMLWLWMFEANRPNEDSSDADAVFSSKGHDAPALYSILIALEKIPFDYIHRLRKLNGLPGHPDIHTSHIITNTGSLGMGISKARGMVFANRLNGYRNNIYVLTGDGELQEGQIWESLQSCTNGQYGEIFVIVDGNKIQSDTYVERTSPLGNLKRKFEAFGWKTANCNGNSFSELAETFQSLKKFSDNPKVIFAETIKGFGVSFMQGVDADGNYKFHSGAPSDEQYFRALNELEISINNDLQEFGIDPINLEAIEKPAVNSIPATSDRLIPAYAQALVELAKANEHIVVLDADLAVDCGLIQFRSEFPERFIECGIAEQDMVSVAGGLALKGKLPIVHSFSCFLSTRPNEQIYNNATERTKIIYVGSLSGIIPGGPGHSHQSVRDISALGAIPGLTIIEPCNEIETRLALKWAVEKNAGSTYIRLVSIPRMLDYKLPNDYSIVKGRGVRISGCEMADIALISYGPVLLQESFSASQILRQEGLTVAVYNFPWLNYVDGKWLTDEFQDYCMISIIDNHYIKHGLGETISAEYLRHRAPEDIAPNFLLIGMNEIPACGTNDEVLKYHELDASSIARKIIDAL